MPIGTTGVDPGLQRPGLLGTPGLNFGDRGYFSGAYNPGSGEKQYSALGMQNLGRIQQTPPDVPEVGAGLPQLQSAMELLGVHSDPMGNLFMDQTGLFTGAGTPSGGDENGGRGGDDTDDGDPRCPMEETVWDPATQECRFIDGPPAP